MAYDTEEEAKPVEDLKGEEKLQRFKDWLRLSSDSDAKQREREKDDLAFQVPENQWTDQAKKDRAGRPMLSISLLQQPIQLVKNQAASARLGVTLTAVNEEATDELAEIKQGLYQRIQRDGLADQARLWALDRAIQAGRGWYRVNTQWDEDSDNPSDQEIVYERILYQEMVFPDPAAKKPDYSDARFIFLTAYVPSEEYKRLYPKADKYSKQDFTDLGSEAPMWVKGGDPLVAEVFYKVSDEEDAVLTDKRSKKELYRRKRDVTKVRRAVLSGCEILEDEEWPGRYIPIIPVIGRELQPIDGERRWEGMVRPTRDAQMVANYAASSIVEDVGRISKAPYIGAEGQFEGYEQEWQESNRRNIPFLQYKNVTLDGKPIGPPQAMQIDGTKMGLSLQLWQESRQWAQITTAVHDPSLGNLTPGDKGQSGRAILALQQQADAGTGNYTGNLAAYSLPYEARVVLDLMPYIYDREGRVTQVLGDEDKASMVMLNAPFVMDQRGRPVKAQPGDQSAKMYDLAKGKYSIAATVGKSFQTRLQQGQEELGTLIPTLPPELQMVLLPTYMRFRDSPGAKEVADLLTKFRDQKFPYLAQKEGEQPTPEQLQAQVAALQQQLQEAQQQLQMAAEAIKTDQAKQQASLQRAEMDAQAGLQKTQLDAQAKQQIAEAEARLKVLLAQLDQSAETRAAALQAAHEVHMQEMKDAAALEIKRLDMAHEVAMSAAGANTMRAVRDRGQSDEREDGQEMNESPGRENVE